MKVSEVIDRLGVYKPDDEIYIEWWDKDLAKSFSYMDDDAELTDEEWGAAVDHLENRERLDQSLVAEAIGEAVDRVVNGEIPV
jgi:hypothetical protein